MYIKKTSGLLLGTFHANCKNTNVIPLIQTFFSHKESPAFSMSFSSAIFARLTRVTNTHSPHLELTAVLVMRYINCCKSYLASLHAALMTGSA